MHSHGVVYVTIRVATVMYIDACLYLLVAGFVHLNSLSPYCVLNLFHGGMECIDHLQAEMDACIQA